MGVIDRIREVMITGEPMASRWIPLRFNGAHPTNLTRAVRQLEAMGYTLTTTRDEEEHARKNFMGQAPLIFQVTGSPPDLLEADRKLTEYIQGRHKVQKVYRDNAKTARNRNRAITAAEGGEPRPAPRSRVVRAVRQQPEPVAPTAPANGPQVSYLLTDEGAQTTPVPAFGSSVQINLLKLDDNGTVKVGIRSGGYTWLCEVIGVSTP